MTYCPDHDPILVAGYISCGGCGARSYPTDAEWVDEELILATFPCTHERTCRVRHEYGTVLLSPDGRIVPTVARPRRCRAIALTTGRRCRGYAQPGSGYCHHHNPARRPS